MINGFKRLLVSCVVLMLAGSSPHTAPSKAAGGETCTATNQSGGQDGHVITGPAATNMARVLMSDRRMSRGHKFLSGRRFRLNLDNAVVIVGNQGERLVFVPLPDETGQREAYLLHAKKGNKEKVLIAVLHSNPRQAHKPAQGTTIVKANYARSQDDSDIIVVDRAYISYNYGDEINYSNSGAWAIVYADEDGAVVDSYEAKGSISDWVKCTISGCGPCIACRWAGPLAVQCVLACCGGAAAGCAIVEIIKWLFD